MFSRKFYIYVFFLLVLAGGISFSAWHFYQMIPGAAVLQDDPVDAIIVLTGDKNRIKHGFDLLKAGRGKLLFISGIRTHYQNVDDLFPDLQTEDTKGKVFIGRKAYNTIENAKESSEFIREKGIRSVYLVTSSYHLPRSSVEFSYFLPYVKIYPYPVDSERKESSRRYLVFTECVKYYFARFWHLLGVEEKE